MKTGFNFLSWFITTSLIFFFAAPGLLNAAPGKQMSLEEAIQKISIRYDVYFTYNKTLVQDFTVDFNENEAQSLEEAMEHVLTGTSLQYRIHENKYVVIYKSDREGISSLKQMAKHLDDLIILEEERSEHSSSAVNLLPAQPVQHQGFQAKADRV